MHDLQSQYQEHNADNFIQLIQIQYQTIYRKQIDIIVKLNGPKQVGRANRPEIRTEVDEEQQTDTNLAEVRTEVDEEQQTNTDSAAEKSEQRQTTDSRFRQTVESIQNIQTADSDRAANQTADSQPRVLSGRVFGLSGW
ncbi:hypothetical protein Tco_1507390 [Tanacetum coccineum]